MGQRRESPRGRAVAGTPFAEADFALSRILAVDERRMATYGAPMSPSLEALQEALATVRDPVLDTPIVDLGIVGEITEKEGDVRITLTLPEAGRGRRHRLAEAVRAALAPVEGVKGVTVQWKGELVERSKRPDDPMPGVRNIVLVMSGKGGVGKSTVATNLTLALRRSGYRVGLLDADIYGPSLPTMFGIHGRPISVDGKSIEPLERFGVKVMSVGFLLEDPKAAVIWRGPMLAGALQQFLKDVNWGDLDFLVLDLPPGTGDVALTLSQRVQSTGAVIVTTPQPVATDDVFKSVSMCQKVSIPVLGVVENMSYFIDSAGVRHELFGRGGGKAVAEFAEAPLLGQVPIDQNVREWGDKGTPVVHADPFSSVGRVFVAIAETLVDHIEELRAEGADDDEAGPVIDRSGGTGRRHLPLAKG